MRTGRIYFPGNPWPEGHPVNEFSWTCREDSSGLVWFDFHLKSADYDAERHVPDDPSVSQAWQAPIVWCNYHTCTLSSTYWGESSRPEVPVCKRSELTAHWLDGRELTADPLALARWDDYERSFHIYLLGHDAVAGHRFKFARHGNESEFDITWTGRIALAYADQTTFDYEFKALISATRMPLLASRPA